MHAASILKKRLAVAALALPLPLVFGLCPWMLTNVFSYTYLPHGFCFLWNPRLLWLHVVSDATIWVSYTAIASTLSGLLLGNRRQIRFRSIFALFGAFILACGFTHLLDVVVLWKPLYWFQGDLKLLTACISLVTAIALPFCLPRVKATLARAASSVENERRFLAAVESSLDSFYILESVRESGEIVDFSFSFVNGVGARLINLSPDTIVGKRLCELVPENRGNGLFARYKQVVESGEPFVDEVLLDIKKVNASWMKLQVVKLDDGIAITASDIGERKQIEREKASALAESLIFNSPAAIIVAGVDRAICAVNPAAEKMLGYEREELIGRETPLIFYDAAEVEALAGRLSAEAGRPVSVEEAVFSASSGAGDGREREWTFRRKHGSACSVQSTVTPLVGENGELTGYMITAYDISERKREDLARQARSVAEQANRAKSEFLANMSHEIRTPMNAILGMTHLALRGEPAPKQRAYLVKIDAAARSLLSIVNEILDFSKIEAGKLELERIPFSLQDVLDRLLDIVGQRAEQKGLAVRFSVPSDVPRFLIGDPLRLGQVLINLTDNAVKFTDAGEIVIAVEVEERAEEMARLAFSVQDTGIGMGLEQIASLFQPFAQADSSITRKYAGTGLGLAISKQLCELMGGNIGVQSGPGQGSNFFFSCVFGVASETPLVQARPRSADLAKRIVLIVDDNETARDVLAAMLDAHGFATDAVSSGEEALAALARANRAGKPFDLVLMDWRMPGLDGIETARRIKADRFLSPIPAILMVSAFERREVMSAAGGFEPDGFLLKPVGESPLIDAIADIFGSETPLEPGGQRLIVSADSPDLQGGNAARLAGCRVLLVEDNEINRDLAAELLEDLGIAVTIAVHGCEGVDLVSTQPFDLVLMDIQMPVMDGLTATRLIRADERFRDLPILAMTAHAMIGDRERSLDAGMNDHIAKPIDPDRLTAALLRWMPAQPSTPAELAPGGKEGSTLAPLRDAVPDFLPPFDIQAALARANGKPGLLRKMMTNFRRRYTHAAADLRGHLAAGRVEEAERLAHSLKSAAAALEARELAVALSSIEEAFRDGETAAIDMLIDAAETLLSPAIDAVRSLERTNVGILETPSGNPIAGPPARPRILIVDDNPDDLDRLAEAFGDGYEIFSAGSGEAALKIASTAALEVVLLDIVMPGIDGYEVCRRLRLDYPPEALSILFITGQGDAAEETRALELGATDYITKPINPRAVRARVDNYIALERIRSRMSEQMARERTRVFAESLIDNSPAAILVAGADYVIMTVNPAAEKMLWYKREELVGRETPLLLYDRSEIETLARRLADERGVPVSPHEAIFAAGAHYGPDPQGEWTFIRKGGSTLTVQVTVTPLKCGDGQSPAFMLTAYDISERKRREEYISHLAHHDRLTKLPTRQLLMDRLEMMLSRAKRYSTPAALLMIDLNNFKRFNDSLGHHVGDMVLVETAERLRQAVRAVDTVARMGGDEFVVLATDLASPEDAELVAEKILAALRPPVIVNEMHRIGVTASIGIAVYPQGGTDPDALMRNADIAMYHSKASGQHAFQVFTSEIAKSAIEYRDMESALRGALNGNELQLHYQPQFSLADGEMIGVEALLRWNSPRFGSVPPGRFIPVAEQSGLILPIGAWVIRAACRQLPKLHREFGPQLVMAVNVSARQLEQADLLQIVEESLRENALDPTCLEVEITESVLMSDAPSALHFLAGLRNLGVRIAIDDFGTGYSSMSYLLRFSVNRLKIDRCFVQDCSTSANSGALTSAIVTLAHQLKIGVVAEGVESQGQMDFLRNAGCDEVQGYYLCRPVPPEMIASARAIERSI